MEGLAKLERRVVACRRCERLVAWREHIALVKRAAYADEQYWARPVPGFGDAGAWLLVVGLAPGAHGSNRTGRMFTGDRSGELLYPALRRAGLCNRAESIGRDDGLELDGVWITAAVRCAPPKNRPSPVEWANCREYLEEELRLLAELEVVVALGGFALTRVLQALAKRGAELPKPRPKFSHGLELEAGGLAIVASYHPSQQNTFTGRLTSEMFDAIWARALALRQRA